MGFKDIFYENDDVLWNVPNDYADDLSPRGRTLTFNGPATFTTDHVDFNGTTDWMDVGGSGDDAGSFDVWGFTIENIVRFTNLTGTQYLYTNNFFSPGVTLKVYLAAGVINMEVAGVVKATFTPTAGVDYNWCVCREDDGTMRFFVNGVQRGSTWTNTTAIAGSKYRIGADNAGANRFLGRQYGLRVCYGPRYVANYTAATPADLVNGDWPNYVRRIQGHVFKPDGTPASYKVKVCTADEFDSSTTSNQIALIYAAFSSSADGSFSFVVRSAAELIVMVDHNSNIYDDPATIRSHKIMRVDPRA